MLKVATSAMNGRSLWRIGAFPLVSQACEGLRQGRTRLCARFGRMLGRDATGASDHPCDAGRGLERGPGGRAAWRVSLGVEFDFATVIQPQHEVKRPRFAWLGFRKRP